MRKVNLSFKPIVLTSAYISNIEDYGKYIKLFDSTVRNYKEEGGKNKNTDLLNNFEIT